MAAINCVNCGRKITSLAKSCPKCGADNVRSKHKTQNDEAIVNVFNGADIQDAVAAALEQQAKKTRGNSYGIAACVFGLLGIFTAGLVFVPIGFFLAVIGFITSTINRNGGGQAWCLLGFFLCGVAFVVSPSLWAVALGVFSV